MIRVILDECLPKKLKYRIEELDASFEVMTATEKGWNSYSNGQLLAKAELEFDVFITSDRNLNFQQTIETYRIQVILLVAPTNIYEDLLPLVDKLRPVITNHSPGSFYTQELQ